MIDTDLKDKVVLVTGANHGIGAATAKAFAAQGAAVLINYLRMPPLGEQSNAQVDESETPGLALYNARRAMTADAVVQAIRQGGGRAEAIEADLADPATIPMLFDRAESLFGAVEVLVNNADYGQADTFLSQEAGQLAPAGYAPETLTVESHDRHFAVNSRAVALMMAEFAHRHMARGARWGRIINVSTDGSAGFVGEVSYGASKYAMESYSRAAASELGKYGITVNVVSPGPIQTGYITSELEQAILPSIPLGCAGLPEDVADVIVFLASEQARWLTGQLLYVGGGHRMA